LKGRERMGSSLPPAELARWDSALFEKMKCIFSIAPVGGSGVLSSVAECTGCTIVSPVLSVRCAGVLVTLSAHESGEHRTLRVCPVACIR